MLSLLLLLFFFLLAQIIIVIIIILSIILSYEVHFSILYWQMSPFEGAPEEFDQTIFPVQGGTIGPVEGLALNFTKEQQR